MPQILSIEADGRLLPGGDGLSEEQRQALDLDRHVTVIAGAGSGKTRTLTRRYVRILGANAWDATVAEADRPPGPESVLVCTFTERAAAEMRTRIRAELGTAVRELRDRRQELVDQLGAPVVDRLSAHLATARERFDRARIGTFHSFAASCLREFAAQVGLDPGFQVLDGAEETLLRERAVEEALAAAEARARPPVLFEAFDRRRLLESLRTWVRRRHDLRGFSRYLDAPDEDLLARWQLHYADVALDELEAATSPAGPLWPLLESFIELEHDLRAPTNPPPAIAQCKRALVMMDAPPPQHPVDRADRLRALARLFRTSDGRGHVAKGHHTWTGKGSALRYPERRREIEQTWNELRPTLIGIFGEHGEGLDTLLGSADRVGVGALKALADLGADAVHRYRRSLAEARSLDFAELEAQLLVLLQDSEVARSRLQRRFNHILGDECQDTNTTQWQVVKLLLGDPLPSAGLFLVGDPKQAIYRFRGGDVTVFERARRELAATGGAELTFSGNFRSRPALIRSFNSLFGWLMPGVDADAPPWEARFEPLSAQRALKDTDAGRIDLVWQELRDADEPEDEVPPDDDTDELEDEPPPADSTDQRARDEAERAEVAAADLPPELSNLPPAHQEARLVAKLVSEALLPGSDVHDGVRVAILLRRRTHLPVYARALREEGVPHVVARGRGFFGRQEVQDLGNLLLALAHRDDAIALLGALRGPFLRLEDAWLLWLARAGRRGTRRDPLVLGWRRVLELSVAGAVRRSELEEETAWSELPPAGRAALLTAAESYLRWRSLSREMALSAFLRQIVSETAAVYGFAKADPTGQAMANVEKLLSLALAYDSRGTEGHADFADFLRAQDALGSDEGEAALDATAPVVLMTIHQSKGLEFPCVVLPDLLQPLRMSGSKPLLLARLPTRVERDPGAADLWEPGIAVPVVEEGRLAWTDMLLRRLIRRQDRWEDVAEARRLLYVAMTRARDRFVALSQPLGDEALSRVDAGLRDEARTWSEWLRLWTVARTAAADLDVHIHLPDPERDSFPDRELIADANRRQPPEPRRWQPPSASLDPEGVLGDLGTLARQLATVVPEPLRRTSPHALQRSLPQGTQAGSRVPPPPPEVDPRQAGIVRGLLVHSCLEDGLTRPSPITRRRARQALAAEGLLTPDAEAWLHAALVRHLRGYRRSAPAELEGATSTVFRELPFRLPLPQVNRDGQTWLDGIIDVVYRLDGEQTWSVLDYKTDEGDPEPLLSAYEPQILAYAWAASRVLPDLRDGTARITGELLFTATGRRVQLFPPRTADEVALLFQQHLRDAAMERAH